MTCGGENGTNGSRLVVFSDDVALPTNSWLPALPPPFHPIGVLVVLAMPVIKLSKMVGNSISYPVYSRYSELLSIVIDL